MGRQVAQDAGLGLAERRGGATRPRRAGPGELAQDVGAQGGVRGALPGMALKKSRRRVDEGGEEHAVGLGQIQGPLDGALGGSGAAEQVAGDRLQQESFHQPDGMACPDGAGDDGRERATVAACGSSPANRSAAMTVRMTRGMALLVVHLGQSGFVGSDRGLVGVADVTATRVASSKTTTALRAE